MDFYQGIDLLDIRRIKKVHAKYGRKFLHKICSKKEQNILYKNYSKQRLDEKIASAFAVKEAASKAFGTGFRRGISFPDFELFYDLQKKPFVRINPKINQKIKKDKNKKISIFVSISNEKNFVIAIVTMISS